MARWLKKPRSLDEITERFDIGRRSVYRWLRYLEEDGYEYASKTKDGNVYFFVVDK